MAVSEEELMQAVDDAAVSDGFLLCPEGGATLAAWRKALESGLVAKDERAILFNCATGLKYPMPDRSKTLDRHAQLDHASL
jgi:threonine synthase